MAGFDKRKDLPPGSVTVTAVMPADLSLIDTPHAVALIRDTYRQQAPGGCDIVMFAVKAGYGQRFADGLAEAVKRGHG